MNTRSTERPAASGRGRVRFSRPGTYDSNATLSLHTLQLSCVKIRALAVLVSLNKLMLNVWGVKAYKLHPQPMCVQCKVFVATVSMPQCYWLKLLIEASRGRGNYSDAIEHWWPSGLSTVVRSATSENVVEYEGIASCDSQCAFNTQSPFCSLHPPGVGRPGKCFLDAERKSQ